MRLPRQARTYVTLCVLLPFFLLLYACGGPTAEPAESDRAGATGTHTATAAAVDSLLAEIVDAWNRDDLAGHMAGYTDSATYTTSGGLMRGRAPIEAMLRRGFERPDGLAGTLLFEDVAVTPMGDAHAMATGAFIVEDVRDTVDIRGRFTLILERTPAGWRITHDHSS